MTVNDQCFQCEVNQKLKLTLTLKQQLRRLPAEHWKVAESAESWDEDGEREEREQEKWDNGDDGWGVGGRRLWGESEGELKQKSGFGLELMKSAS